MVVVETRKGPIDVSVSPGMTVFEFKVVIQKLIGLPVNQQGLKVKAEEPSLVKGEDAEPVQVIRLTDQRKVLADYGVSDSTTLVLSDLGLQIGYRTVFIIEYLGETCNNAILCAPVLAPGIQLWFLTHHRPYPYNGSIFPTSLVDLLLNTLTACGTFFFYDPTRHWCVLPR